MALSTPTGLLTSGNKAGWVERSRPSGRQPRPSSAPVRDRSGSITRQVTGGTVFRTKTKTEQATEAVSSSAQSAADYAVALKERVAPAAEVAKERATGRAS